MEVVAKNGLPRMIEMQESSFIIHDNKVTGDKEFFHLQWDILKDT